MRSAIRFLIFALVSVMALVWVAPLAAQQIRYEDFSSIANLQLNGSSHQATWQGLQVLRLTDGPLPGGGNPETATTYSTYKQQVAAGFTGWPMTGLRRPLTPNNLAPPQSGRFTRTGRVDYGSPPPRVCFASRTISAPASVWPKG